MTPHPVPCTHGITACQGWKRPSQTVCSSPYDMGKETQTQQGKSFTKLPVALLRKPSVVPEACGKPPAFPLSLVPAGLPGSCQPLPCALAL